MKTDHRGTGRSSPLRCQTSETPENADSCYNKFAENPNFGMEGIHGFSTTNAAKDLLHWIDILRDEHPSGKAHTVAIYGVSYGTYWLNRALQIGPEKVNMAIADSTVTPASFDFGDWDQHYTEIGTNFLKECTNNAKCSEIFAADFGKTEKSVTNGLPNSFFVPFFCKINPF